jgi:clan AA aspartic protease (TIGR02281 family)
LNKLHRALAALSIFASFNVPAIGETAAPNLDAASAAVNRLGLDLPLHVIERETIRQHLEELGREPCDQKAIVSLGAALDRAGYRREQAKAHLKFSETCRGFAPSVRAAANIFLSLSDFEAAAAAASVLIGLEPFADNGYFLRAVAYEKAGLYGKAIDDYKTAIELYGDKSRIASVSYEGLARSLDKLGQYCEAAASIEMWVALNPARHETSQSRAIINRYRAKGSCAAEAPSKEEVFSVSRISHGVTVPVTVNGVRGTFLLDTGASFVSLKSSFAEKARVNVDPDSSIKLNTANGFADAKSGRAKSIQLRSLVANDVSVIVQSDNKGLYGDHVDGLLGMSFLSRFKVSIDGMTVRVRNLTAN